MAKKKILYISGSVGLGHLTRDLSIAGELRRQNPDVEIFWVSAPSMSRLLIEAGEVLHPKTNQYADDNISIEKVARGFRLNLLKYTFKARKEWACNVEVFKQIVSESKYDVVIGDETHEINVALSSNPDLLEAPFVMILDFVGLDAMTQNPIEKVGVSIWNRRWPRVSYRLFTTGVSMRLDLVTY